MTGASLSVRLAFLPNRLVQSPAQEARVVLRAGNAVEDCVERVVLFRDEDHVLDLFGRFAGLPRE